MDLPTGMSIHKAEPPKPLLTADSIYVDVTDSFFTAVEKMAPGNVVASPYFDMLEGSRAIEMGNRRLDTGLIDLKHEEVMFDTAAGQLEEDVAGAMNHVLILLMLWFLGLSLPVTLFSNRYVMDFLQSYNSLGGQFAKSNLVNKRLHGDLYTESSSFEGVLVNKVLRSYVAGICKFAGIVRDVALNVLYDEEDLTTRNMDLNMLTAVESSVVLETIEDAQQWLQSQQTDQLTSTLNDFLTLASCLVQTCDIVHASIHLFEAKDGPSLESLADIRKLASKIEGQDIGLGPRYSVSKFAQIDCNNKHIPYDNFLLPKEKAFSDLRHLADEIEAYVSAFATFDNALQLESYLRYSMAPRMTPDYSSVARGFFQLFFIRDDKSVVGLSETVGSVSIRLMESLCCAGASILDTETWKLQEDDPLKEEAAKREALNKVGALLDDFENAMYKYLSNFGNNKCRQRQFDNQTIVLWDTLQFNAENIEFNLFSAFGLGDKIAPDSPNPALPITAFAYHMKLQIMLETILSGFELNLYKPFEASQMYWYAGYLAENDHANMKFRVTNINKGKLAQVASLSKKVKKAKAGQKKEELKKLYKSLNENAIPQVHRNLKYIEQFLEPSVLALQHLCIAISQILLLYQLLNADMKKPGSMVDDEHLYNLRMKPWRSVEVPTCPSYKDYREASLFYDTFSKIGIDLKRERFKGIIELLKGKLVEALQIYGGILDSFKNTETLEQFFKGSEESVKLWILNLRKTCVAYQVELGNVLHTVQTMDSNLRFKVEIGSAYHPHFPIYSMKKIE